MSGGILGGFLRENPDNKKTKKYTNNNLCVLILLFSFQDKDRRRPNSSPKTAFEKCESHKYSSLSGGLALFGQSSSERQRTRGGSPHPQT